jgi:bifunctional polynucleotide phosphatase/kinase
MATEKDPFRKPGRRMWDQFVTLCLQGAAPSSDSFYCGDAAGSCDCFFFFSFVCVSPPLTPRSGFKDWMPGKPKDFASSDRKFAANIGLKFFTPEELFLGIPPTTKWNWGSFDPKDMIQKFARKKKRNVCCVVTFIS